MIEWCLEMESIVCLAKWESYRGERELIGTNREKERDRNKCRESIHQQFVLW